ncbi:MAG: hypothetical protein IKN55_05655 [Oscillospiraceae bacterium]|nr:hypothetical protein [Oscillospiraceae bacterium]
MRRMTKYTALACMLPLLLMLLEGGGVYWLTRYPEHLTHTGLVSISVTLLAGVVLEAAGMITLLIGKTNDDRMHYGMLFNYIVSAVMIGISILMMRGGVKPVLLIMVPVLALTFLLAVNLQYGHRHLEQVALMLCSPLLTWLGAVLAWCFRPENWFIM